MRKLHVLAALTAAFMVAAVAATTAQAATPVPVTIKLVEALRAPSLTNGCPDIGVDVNCGTGELKPFGQADSIVSINGCGDNCSIRWITVSGGTLVLRESLSNITCPGPCVTQWPHGGQFWATTTAEVVFGTGVFAGATGRLTGTLKAVAWVAQIKYSGTIVLAS
jgi:hypothetical protein